MIIFVISDTHGQIDNVLEYINNVERPDLILFLGDYVKDGQRIEKKTGVKCFLVRGNNDFEQDIPFDNFLKVNGHKIFMTHGHRYRVSSTVQNLYEKALKCGADIILFGHTHRAFYDALDGVKIFNPGSTSLPRDINRVKSFLRLEINSEISFSFIELFNNNFIG